MGFIRAARSGRDEDALFTGFLMDAQRAARDVSRLPGTVPGQLVAAMQNWRAISMNTATLRTPVSWPFGRPRAYLSLLRLTAASAFSEAFSAVWHLPTSMITERLCSPLCQMEHRASAAIAGADTGSVRSFSALPICEDLCASAQVITRLSSTVRALHSRPLSSHRNPLLMGFSRASAATVKPTEKRAHQHDSESMTLASLNRVPSPPFSSMRVIEETRCVFNGETQQGKNS